MILGAHGDVDVGGTTMRSARRRGNDLIEVAAMGVPNPSLSRGLTFTLNFQLKVPAPGLGPTACRSVCLIV